MPHIKQKEITSSNTNKTTLASIENKWKKVTNILLKQIGATEHKNWIQPLSICSIQNKILEIIAPNRFLRDWVSMHYTNKISDIWKTTYPNEIISINIITAPKLHTQQKNIANNSQNKIKTTTTNNGQTDTWEDEQPKNIIKKYALDPRFTFDNFVIGKSNELAAAAAKRVAEDTKISFNPLFLYSGVGLGKTHLMHAIGWKICESFPDKKIIYMSAEKFMYEFIHSLQNKNVMSFKEKFRNIDIFMVDDIQFIAGKEKVQDEFFHTFNSLIEQNKQIVISGNCPPSEIKGLTAQLCSRLNGGLLADIQQTDYELRLAILKSKLKYIKNIEIPISVLEFIADKITTNVRELEGALNKVAIQAEITNKPVTIKTTQYVLQDILRSNTKEITIDHIQKTVASCYNIKASDITSKKRARHITRPRQIAMYITKLLTPASLPEIGREFGGRDHTTALYAIRKIEDLIPHDTELSKSIDILINKIKYA